MSSFRPFDWPVGFNIFKVDNTNFNKIIAELINLGQKMYVGVGG